MLAVLGGVFDPPHFGHIKPAFELAQCPEITQLRLLPCRKLPHKQIVADDMHRLTMLQLIEKPPLVVVDTYEIEQANMSYTVDTLSYFRRQIGSQLSLAFVLGQDAFLNITEWFHYQQLLEFAHLIVTVRPGYSVADDHALLQASGGWSPLSELARTPMGKITLFTNKVWDISSSKIQALIAEQQQARYLMPGVIWNYIRRNQLYGYRNNAG